MTTVGPSETHVAAGRIRPIPLHGPDGFPDGAASFSRRLNRPIWEGGCEEPVAVLFRRSETLRTATLWSAPFTAWIDLVGLDDERLQALLDRAGDAHLFASVTSATAHDLQLAHRLVEALRNRGELTEPGASDIEFALHEAISNALLHGNLELESMKGLSLGDLDRFSDQFAHRLKDPVLSARRIEVTVRFTERRAAVEVSDEGDVFTPGPRCPAGPDDGSGQDTAHRVSGRGLDLIAGMASSLELLEGGRRIRMEFAL